jgi:hypothetical protein
MGGKHVRRNTFGLVWDSDDEAAVRSVATGCLFEFEWFEGCAWLSYSIKQPEFQGDGQQNENIQACSLCAPSLLHWSASGGYICSQSATPKYKSNMKPTTFPITLALSTLPEAEFAVRRCVLCSVTYL